MRFLWPAATAALLLAAVDLQPSPAAPAPASRPAAAVRAATANGWPTYHYDNTREGANSSIPTFYSRDSAHDWSVNNLDENVFASPVTWNGLVYVATENDTVYALNESTGAVAWSNHVASPIPGTATYIGCSASQFGGHNGITGTPAVDPATGEVYVVATVDLGSGSSKYTLFALNGSTGATLWSHDLSSSTSLSGGSTWGPIVGYQNQRGALAVANGYVYVPFGGRDGDCGTYHPYVEAVPVAGGGPAIPTTYQPQTAGQNEAGIWAPSGESVDGSGNVYVETGNGSYGSSTPCDNSKWDHGDAVIKLSPSLAELGSFAPTNWCDLNAADADLGSIAPVVLPNTEILASGKSGDAWLMNGGSMPGFGAPQQQQHLNGCGTGDAVFGGFAYSAPYAYVPCDGNGVVALSINATAGAFSQAWTARAPGGGTYSPGAPIVAGGVLWDEPQGGGAVYGYDPGSGALKFNIGLSAGAHRFTTLAADGNRLFAMLSHGVQSLAFVTPVSFTPVEKVYFTWYDRVSSPNFKNDNVHVVNPSNAAVFVNVTIPGLPGCSYSGDTIPALEERYYGCATGLGGPVVVEASAHVIASQRVQYGATFNEVPGQVTASSALVFPWYDLISDPGFRADNIHVVNPNAGGVTATVSIPGCAAQSRSIAGGGESFFNCPGGIGGPVTVTSTGGGVIASQRVVYYDSFNEEPAQPASAAATAQWVAWYDLATDASFLADNIHVVNPGLTDTVAAVAIPGCGSQAVAVPHGGEAYLSCPGGFGGPVRITTSNGVGVLASARVKYAQTFNEVTAQPSAAAAGTLFFTWYDLLSDPAFRADNVHVINPNAGAVSVTVTIPGCGPQGLSIAAQSEGIFACPGGFGGPVTVRSSGGHVLASKRVLYGQSFNEVGGQP